jgi:hypothetical protein
MGVAAADALHDPLRDAFDGSRRRAELGLDHQPMTVLGQRVADVGELGLLAFALAIEPGLRVGGRRLHVVAALLAVEVAFAIAAARRGLVRGGANDDRAPFAGIAPPHAWR